MFAWLALLALLVGEIIALRWWLNREYYPVLFNGWAVTLYALAFTATASLVWVVSLLFEPGGHGGMLTLMILGILAVAICVAFTFFFRWVARQDLPDPPQ